MNQLHSSLYDHQRKKYCTCGGLLDLDDVDTCKWCQGWHKEIDLPATQALNQFNSLGQVKVWKWVRNSFGRGLEWINKIE